MEASCCLVTSWIVASFLAAGNFTALEVFFLGVLSSFFEDVVDLALAMPLICSVTFAEINSASLLFFLMTNEFLWGG